MKKIIASASILTITISALFAISANAHDPKDDREGGPRSHSEHHEERSERWKNASPEKRERMKARHEKWENASPEEREKMKARHEKWKNASPEEREKMRDNKRERHSNRTKHRDGDETNARRHHREGRKNDNTNNDFHNHRAQKAQQNKPEKDPSAAREK